MFGEVEASHLKNKEKALYGRKKGNSEQTVEMHYNC